MRRGELGDRGALQDAPMGVDAAVQQHRPLPVGAGGEEVQEGLEPASFNVRSTVCLPST